jgi:hypothetical protein
MPPANDDFIKGAFEDHKKALTRPLEDSSMYETFVLQRVKSEIANICEQVFKNKEFVHRDPIPSMRASQENGLLAGGGLGTLVMDYVRTRGFNPVVHEPCLFGMVEYLPGEVRSFYFHDWESLVRDFQDYVDITWLSRLDEPLHCTPCPIKEPLKVRMITKGQAAEYYRTIEIQKFMHGCLKKHPMFEYIGHPIDDLSWSMAFGTLEDLPLGYFYVSGDYKAATDNLNPILSQHAWECICHYTYVEWAGERKPLFDTPYFLLGRKALTEHMLHYPGVDLNDAVDTICKILSEDLSDEEVARLGSDVKQSWGQLMGSPMSFPILCIVNAAASLVSLGQSFSDSYPMKVNGDDIAFIANDEEYACWKEVTRICGLEFSLGKNYTSREFIIMNSELRRPPSHGVSWTYTRGSIHGSPLTCGEGTESYWCENISWEERPALWKLEGFLNQSVLYHKVKKGMDAGEQKDVYWTDFESLGNEAIRGIPEKDQMKMLRIFLVAHHSVLEEMPANCNLWFPVSLGGAGMPVPTTTSLEKLCAVSTPNGLPKYKKTRLLKQRKQAAYLACTPTERMRRFRRSKRADGIVGEIIKDTLDYSNSQVPARIGPKPLNREQHTMLGGKTLLGYMIRGLGALDYLLEEKKRVDTEVRQAAHTARKIGGVRVADKETASKEVHRKEAAFLKRMYDIRSYAAMKSSLQPMKLEKIRPYQEHVTMLSFVELIREGATTRVIDEDRKYRLLNPEINISGDVYSHYPGGREWTLY